MPLTTPNCFSDFEKYGYNFLKDEQVYEVVAPREFGKREQQNSSKMPRQHIGHLKIFCKIYSRKFIIRLLLLMNRLGQNHAALIRRLGLAINFITNPPTTLGSKSFNSNLVRQSADL